MKFLLWLCMLPVSSLSAQTIDITKLRELYHRAAEVKQDAMQLDVLLSRVDSDATPLLVCYKGANEMMQAKYALNPLTKLDKFNKGKDLIGKAFSRDSAHLEMRFIRYTIQGNLPGFLNYRKELETDKQFLLNNTKNSKDTALKEMIINYLSVLKIIKPEELKQLTN